MAQSLDFTFNGKDRTQQAFRSLNQSISRTQQGFDRLKGAMGALAGVAGVTALASFASNMSKTADRIGKVASKLGISTEALQKFQFSAEQSGVSTETLNMAFQRFTRRIADAKDGAGPAVKAFEEMGISLSGVNGQTKTAEELFFEVADAMKGVESETERVKLAFKLFDSEGVGMINMLQNGSEAIIAQGKQLEDYGGIIDEKAIRATERFNDAMNLFSKSARGAFSDAVLGIDDFIKRLVRGYDNISKMFNTDDVNLLDAELMNLQELEDISKDLLTNINRRIQKQNELNSAHAKLKVGGDAYLKVGKIIERMDKGTNKLMDDRIEIIKLINMKQGQYAELIEDEIKKEKEVIKTQTEQQKFYVLAIDGVTKIGQAIDENGNKVNLLTKEQADQLTQAIAIEKAQIAQKNVTEAQRIQQEEQSFLLALQRATIEEQNAGLKEQEKRITEIDKKIKKALFEKKDKANDFVGMISQAGDEAGRFLDALGVRFEVVGGKLQMMTDSMGMFALRMIMSNKKVQRSINRVFGFMNRMIDGVIGNLLDGADANEEYKKRLQEINAEVEAMGTSIDDFAFDINHASSEMRQLAQIEKTYQDRVAKANKLDAEHLKYYAQIEKDIGILAYRVGVLRSATQAFASSAQQFLDAVATEGFTDIQKRFFAMTKGFERGTKKAFGDIIKQADAIIAETPLNPQMMVKAFKEIQKSMQMRVAGDFGPGFQTIQSILDKYGITKEDTPIAGLMNEIKTFLDKGGAGQFTAETIRRMTEKYMGVIASGITAMDAKIAGYNEAVEAKAKAEAQMPEALKGLVIMLKDVMKTEFISGATKEQLKLDVDALSETFKGLGIDLNELKTFIDNLTKGAMGGLVKKYPYGGSISGPSHSSGGVMAELEGGEFVMRKSSVQKYGSDFMNQVNQGQHGGSVDVSVYLDMEGQVKLPLHQYIVGVQSRAERAGNPELAGILAG
mgnify:CR=1 FL=1